MNIATFEIMSAAAKTVAEDLLKEYGNVIAGVQETRTGFELCLRDFEANDLDSVIINDEDLPQGPWTAYQIMDEIVLWYRNEGTTRFWAILNPLIG